MIRTFFTFAAAVSFLVCLGSGWLWSRSYRTVDDLFVIFQFGGASEQVRSIGGLFVYSHAAPDGGRRGGIEHFTVRHTRFESISPRPFGETFIAQDWGLFQFVDERYQKQRFSPQVIGALRAKAALPPPTGPVLPAVWTVVMRAWAITALLAALPILWLGNFARKRFRRKSGKARVPSPGQRVRRGAVGTVASACLVLCVGAGALWISSHGRMISLFVVTSQNDQWRAYSSDGLIGVDNQPAVFLNSRYSRYTNLTAQISALESQLAAIPDSTNDPKLHALRANLSRQIYRFNNVNLMLKPMIVGRSISLAKPTVALGAVAVLLIVILWIRRPASAGHCRVCNYDLTGNTSGVCPECGAAVGKSEITATVPEIRREGRPI